MKFCFKLVKSAEETHEMQKLVYGEHEDGFTSGSSDFVMVVNRLKTRRDRDFRQHQKLKRMLKE